MSWFSKRFSEEALKHRARKEYNNKNYSKAEKSLRKLKKIAKDETWANDVLARLYMNTGRHSDAIPLWHANMDRSKDPHRELQYLIDCYRVTKKYEQGLSIISKSKLLGDDDDATWNKTQLLIEEIDDYIPLKKFVDEIKHYTRGAVNLDFIELRISQLQENFEDIDLITSRMVQRNTISEMSVADAHQMASLLTKSNHHSHALIILELLDDSDEVIKQKINSLRMIGEYSKALKQFQQVYNPGFTDISILISGIRLGWDMGDMKIVQSLSSEVLKQNPDHHIATRFNLQSLVKLGDLPSMRSAIKPALETSHGNLEAHYTAINIAYEEDKDYQKVIEICEEILSFDPENIRALCKRIHALREMGRHGEMLEHASNAQSIVPDNDEILLTSAQAEWKANTGKHIDCVNKMLDCCDLAPIKSSSNNKSLSIQFIECEPETKSNHTELVSIIMTVYGRDEYLDVAINSILDQTHRNLELIVVDDYSTDDAWDYLQSLSENDPRIKPIRVQKNGGTYLAKNLGLTKAKGDYIAFMDSDDWTHPQRLERQISILKSSPEAKAVWHKYFRIDEAGNIIFRGKGAIRNACISLMCKKEIFDELGYFDALRVGADTEFVERIQAYFGKSTLIGDPIPSMFMLQHSSSLTGGGKFHISWRSITDYRLAYHSSFREWHRQISNGKTTPFLPHPLRVRPFSVPEEMLAGESQWKQGMNLFGEMIQKRNYDWWKGKKQIWQKHLSEKLRGEEFVIERNIPVVPKVFITKMYDDPRFQELPDSYVIKTSVGYSAKQVFPVKNGKNVFTNQSITIDEILAKLQEDSFVQNQKHQIIVEELVSDEFGHKIPLDYKFFMFGENVATIMVVDRPSLVKKEQSRCYYDEDWKRIPINMMSSWKENDRFKKPKFFDEMLGAAKVLGKELGIFMRIDFYTTENGYYFGEFTPTPDGGKGYSEQGNRYLGSFWKGDEGVLDGNN